MGNSLTFQPLTLIHLTLSSAAVGRVHAVWLIADRVIQECKHQTSDPLEHQLHLKKLSLFVSANPACP